MTLATCSVVVVVLVEVVGWSYCQWLDLCVEHQCHVFFMKYTLLNRYIVSLPCLVSSIPVYFLDYTLIFSELPTCFYQGTEEG